MKFLLIKGESFSEKFMSQPYYPPLGLLYVGAALEHDGHKVEIIDFSKEINAKEHIQHSLISADAVGITLFTDNFELVSNITKIIRDVDSSIPIILGGSCVTDIPEQSLKSIPNANISVKGEGEKVAIDIARFLEGKKNLSEISGVYYRDNDSIKRGKEIEIIENLDSLDYPARHLTAKYEYEKADFFFKPKFTTMETSRGCPFHCRFCARPNNTIPGYGFRQRSAENVVNEIIEINENYGTVCIVDDNFLTNKKRADLIFQKLIESGTDINLMIQGSRVDSADTELYKKMKKANVKYISYGIESGNQDVLDYYNKKLTLEDTRRAINLSKKMGFVTLGSFILGAPIETKEHFQNTIKFAYSLPLDIVLFYALKYVKGSSLWIDAVNDKKIKEDEYVVCANSQRNLGNFTEDELIEETTKAQRNFYLRPRYIFDQIYQSFYRRNFKLLKIGFRLITLH